jgi:hypothetical protein
MSSPEVDYVLDRLASVVSDVEANFSLASGDPVQVKRVDRDDGQLYDSDQSVNLSSPIRTRSAELRSAVLVGASLVDVSSQPIGTEYDHRREAVVSVRCEGLHVDEYGHVDPGGTDGVPFNGVAGSFVQRVRDALLNDRTFPNAGRPDVEYTDLRFSDESPQSGRYADYFRWDGDVLLRGYEDL